jgi:tetratricopeptide (TPR) repeat protein
MLADTETLLQQAAEALKSKEYAKAEVLQRRGYEQLLREERVEESRLSTELEKLADIHCTQKKFEQCANEYAEVVQMREKFMPANDFNILRPLYRLAKSHFEGQNYESAEAEMRKALTLSETRTDSPESVAFCLYELGWLLYYVGKYLESEPYLLKALPICDTVHGGSHPQTIQVLGGIGLLYKNCQDLGKDPEPFFRRAIAASKSKPDLRQCYLANLYRLALFFDEAKRFDNADDLFLQLLPLINGKSEQTDSDNRWIIRGCVEYFSKRGKQNLVADLVTSEAENCNAYTEMVQERMDHAAQTLSEDDPELVEALLAAGNNATFEGKYQEAEPLLERALAASLKIHGEKSSQTLFALNRVCIVKRVLGKFDDAESAIRQALDGAKECFFNDGFYPWSLQNLALLREAEEKIEDAVKIYAEAVSEYERICGFPSYEAVEAMYRQSACLLRTGNVAAAETAIRRAISVMDKIEELSGYEKSDYLATLALILEASGRNSEAEEMRNRAQQLLEQSKKENESETEGIP